jgi:hypothetical protein
MRNQTKPVYFIVHENLMHLLRETEIKRVVVPFYCLNFPIYISISQVRTHAQLKINNYYEFMIPLNNQQHHSQIHT